MANSIDDVLAQMRGYGLEPPYTLELKDAFKGYVRWRPEGQKGTKKSAWARLYSWVSPKTQVEYISGAFGNRGDTYMVESSSSDWSPAERAAEMEARKAAAKEAEAERAQDAQKAADKAETMWKRAREADQSAQHEYLAAKRVSAFGLRVAFKRLLVPLRDLQGKLHGLQYIDPDGAKLFGTGTVKEGHFHLIGEVQEGQPIAFGEGYATCASGHMATGWPVVTCFDAGNLDPVIGAWRKLYPDHIFVLLADDDRHLMQRLAEKLLKHGITVLPGELKAPIDMTWDVPDGPKVECKAAWKADSNGGPMRLEGSLTVNGQVQMLKIENAGMAKAALCVKRHKVKILAPVFPADHQGTDWNDYHAIHGLEALREALLKAFEAPAPAKKRASASPQAEAKRARPEEDNLSFLERFTLIYGTTTVWDHQEKMIVKLEGLKVAFGKSIDWWLGSYERRMVLPQNVVFDPSGEVAKPDTHVNLFDELPTKPDPEARCELIVEHLNNLCGNDQGLFDWVANWLALPLQRMGTKMRTSLIIHGRMEGTGKSLMMDIMRAIYGRYSRSISQVQLTSEFNGWQSGMLFCVAEEVVSASERKNLKNLIQNLITNPVVQINEKNMPVREERSFCNFTFLSNEQLPMLLNDTDRRYTVIQAERRFDREYFKAIGDEMDHGGVGAFLQWLLERDLKDFDEFSLPYETRARVHLITLGMTPDQRFVHYWKCGLADLPFCSCPSRDLYTAFKAWCRLNGEKYVAHSTQFGRTVTEVLERMGAPPKRVVRFDAFSANTVDKGDFAESDKVLQQGLVYFVQASAQRLALDGGVVDEKTKDEDCTKSDVFNERIVKFQVKLHELIVQARHAL